MTVRLTQPGSRKEIRVADEHADRWRAQGYRDVETADSTPRKTTAKKSSAKKS